MKTPITYYGGKQRLAKTIISMLPPHKIYCEPYFGGGAVFFEKPKAAIEVINDIDDKLINFYLVVQNKFDELQDMIRQTLHSQSIYYHAKDIWNGRVTATDVGKAWAIWLITNGSFAGSMHGGWKWCNGTSGGHTATFMKNKRNSFTKALQERLDNVQISCFDALKVIKDRDTPDTVFYLDPPYPGSHQGHYKGFTHEDLADLLETLSSLNGKFILSNYWTQTLKDSMEKFGWNHKEINVQLSVARLNRDQPLQNRTEVLIYNYNLQRDLFTV